MQTFSASYHQERLWFIDNFENGTLYKEAPVYHNLPLILKIYGKIQESELREALQILSGRHEALHTRVLMKDEQVVQVTSPECTIKIRKYVRHDLARNEKSLFDFCLDKINDPFLIAKESLFRTYLIELAADQHVLIFVAHHLIADRRSMDIILREFNKIYNSLIVGTDPNLPALPIQYADFANWQKEFSPEAISELMFFWREHLGSIEPLTFYTDYPRKQVHVFEAGNLKVKLAAEIVEKIRKSGEDEYHLFFTALATLMHKYTRQNKIMLGAIFENRDMEETEGLVGPVANLLPINSHIQGDQLFDRIIVENKESYIQACNYGSLPFDKLITELNPEKDMSRTALFDVLFHYEDRSKMNSACTLGTARYERVEANLGLGKYDFNFLISKLSSNEYAIYLTYNKLYYKPETAQRLLGHYMTLLSGVGQKKKIADLDYVTKDEQAELKTLLDKTNVKWPKDHTLVTLFEAQVLKTASKTAVVAGQTTLTYQELNEIVNRFSSYLAINYGIGHGSYVALLLPRDERQLIAMLAVLKCGAAYVPIDLEYPADRIKYTINDSDAGICITEDVYAEFLNSFSSYSAANPQVAAGPDDLAYIIYTSGSTGQPKGAMIEHRNVVRLFVNDAPIFDFGAEDVWAMFHSYCFDFSVWEMYGALLFGGTLIVIPKHVAADSALFLDLLVIKGITVLNQTPSAFYNLLKVMPWDTQLPLAVRYVIFGGEALHASKLERWKKCYPAVRLINMYGITETTVHVTYKDITEKEIADSRSNIGTPIPTTSGYILDDEGKIVPKLIPGELWVGGEGVGRGYLKQEALTMQKFVPNPFGTGKLYASGDLVRILSNNELEYIGRKDNQVKIRGFRIEPGEVEKALLKNKEIKEAVVVTNKDKNGDNELTAYFVSTKKQSVPDLLIGLKGSLPPFMLPSHYVQVDEFKLNNNGKIDKSVLPALVCAESASSIAYVSPRNEFEQKIIAIWEEILERKNIGVHDDFFALGGHSIKAIRMLNAYNKTFGVKLTMRELFDNLTLESHAKLITDARKTKLEDIQKGKEQEHYPLSTAQQRLWVLSQFEEASVAYNMPSCVVLDGMVDIESFKKAILALIDRHEALRTIFKEDDSYNIRQWIWSREVLGIKINALDLRYEADSDRRALQYMSEDAVKRFDLAEGPLLRIALLQVTDSKYYFYYNLHHIISDGWSGNVIMRDLLAYYEAFRIQQEPTLPELDIQYKDFAVWQDAHMKRNSFLEHRDFWLKQLGPEIPKLNLSIARVRPNIKSYSGAKINGTVPVEVQQKLHELVIASNSSIFTNLLGVVSLLLYRYSYQKEMIIGTPVAGRMHGQLENQVGFYVNTVPLKISLDLKEDYTTFGSRLKNSTLQAFDYQDYPFDILVDELNQGNDLSRSPIFDVMLILNEHESEGDWLAGGISGELLEIVKSKYDLSFVFNGLKDKINLNLIYNTDLFNKEDVEKMSSDLIKILTSVAESPDQTNEAHINSITGKEELSEQASFFADISAQISDDF